jgi:hypothetical protein
MYPIKKTFACTLLLFIFCINSVLYADCQKTIVFTRHGEKDEPVSYGQLNCQGQNRALALPQVLNAKFGKPEAIYACNPSITSKGGCADFDGCCTHSRPYATINPTAVLFSMQVLATYGSGNLGGPISPDLPKVKCDGIPPATPMLQLPQQPSQRESCGVGSSNGDADLARDILRNNAYCGKTVIVTWEHTNIDLVVYNLFNILGLDARNKIPAWPYGPCLYSYCHPDECSQGYNFDSLYIVRINQDNFPPTIDISFDNEGLNGQSTVCPS